MSTWNVNLDSAWRSSLSKDTCVGRMGKVHVYLQTTWTISLPSFLWEQNGTNMLIYFALSNKQMTNDCQVSIYDAVSGQNVQVSKSPFILRPSSAQSASASLKNLIFLWNLYVFSTTVTTSVWHVMFLINPTTWPPWSGRAGRRGRPWKDGKVHCTLTVPSILPYCAQIIWFV